MSERKKRLSMLGLVFAIVASILIVILDQVLFYKFKVEFIKSYYVINWFIYGLASGGAYLMAKTGREGLFQAVLVAFLSVLTIECTTYLSEVVIIAADQGESFSKILSSYSIKDYIFTAYTQEINITKINTGFNYDVAGWTLEIGSYMIPFAVTYGLVRSAKEKK